MTKFSFVYFEEVRFAHANSISEAIRIILNSDENEGVDGMMDFLELASFCVATTQLPKGRVSQYSLKKEEFEDVLFNVYEGEV